MMLERFSPGPIGFERRLFECPKCDHVEINAIASDPFTSNAAGWLAGELRRQPEGNVMLWAPDVRAETIVLPNSGSIVK